MPVVISQYREAGLWRPSGVDRETERGHTRHFLFALSCISCFGVRLGEFCEVDEMPISTKYANFVIKTEIL